MLQLPTLASPEASNKKITVEGREFRLDLLRFTNGCFLSVTEGNSAKLGAVNLSIKTVDRSTSTALIPSRFGEVFPTMIGEIVASRVGGVVVTSLHLLSSTNQDTVRDILNGVKDLLGPTETLDSTSEK